MSRILVIYHSQTGNTQQMALAVARGAASVENTDVILKKAEEATLDDLIGAEGLAIGTPENFGYMSGMVKDFFDRTYEQARDRVLRKPYAVFISAGNDGTGAQASIERIARGYKLKKICEPVISRGSPTEAAFDQCRELGALLAAGCDAGIF